MKKQTQGWKIRNLKHIARTWSFIPIKNLQRIPQTIPQVIIHRIYLHDAFDWL
jgi:hypothetical protein